MIVRAGLYFFAILALLLVVLALAVLGAMAAYGVSVVRSDAFGLIAGGFILIAVPAALVAARFLARKR